MRFTVNDNANASIQNGEDVTANGNYYTRPYARKLPAGSANFLGPFGCFRQESQHMLFNPIPEPQSLSLLAIGAVGLLIALRRKK